MTAGAVWLGLALLLLPARPARAPARHRSRTAVGRGAARPAAVPGPALPAVAAAATVVLAVLAGSSGTVLALPLAAAAWLATSRWQARNARRPADPRSVAFVVDLLAGALAAGSPPQLAIERVAAAVVEHGTDDLRRAVEPLGRVGRLLQLGSEPAQAWQVLRPVPGYGTVAECGSRCASSGARLAQALATVATELRAAAQAEALARAERVGVWSLLPLGLCFLPAFVCLGVLPVVLGVTGEVFAGVPG
ncbi:type II secretion system F family protein [Jatrophihabitans sp.]|uniref:type II secretion system F family protein n=1 Tax=Jatrophihabitans sp. TaxID=1932789 RepID=UPI002BBC84EC|nr:type II secretion system F family protein [Jatrophihabitans sp.]